MQSQVYIWLEDAQSKLIEAETICSKANEYINLTNQKLISRDNDLSKLIYLLDANKQQLRLLGVIKDSLVVNLQELTSLKDNLNLKVTKDLNKLMKTLDILNQTKVEKSFQKHETILIDFIDETAINNLISQIHVKMKNIEDLFRQNRTDALLIRLDSDIESYNNEFNNLNSQFNELKLVASRVQYTDMGNENHTTNKSISNSNGSSNPDTNPNETINKLLDINNELELDMVSILSSFNDHYNQCNSSIDFFNDPKSPQDEKLQLMEVLNNDFQELPNFLNLLNNDCDNIIKNCEEILRITSKFENLMKNLKQFTTDLDIFGKTKLITQYINDFAKSTKSVRMNLNDTLDLRVQINQFASDYNQFIKSYHNLIVELVRRKEMNTKIENLINSFKLSLNDLKQADLVDRENFLLSNGDYLPLNIIDSSLFNDQNLLIHKAPYLEISMQKEELPDISVLSKERSLKYLNMNK